MRIAFTLAVAALLVLTLWHGADAQNQAVGSCFAVSHGAIGFQTMRYSSRASSITGGGSGSSRGEEAAPQTWEAVLVNRCTGETWKRDNYRDAWEPVGRR